MTNHPRVVYGTIMSGTTQHPVIAVDAGQGRANCITLDKGWSLLRKWEEVEVEQEYTVYSPDFPQEQAGWEAILRQIAEARSAAAAWEDQALDYRVRLELAEQRIRELEGRGTDDPMSETCRGISLQLWGVEFSELDEEVQEFVVCAAERLIQKREADA